MQKGMGQGANQSQFLNKKKKGEGRKMGGRKMGNEG
jgi:hypothetical protein